MESSTMEEVLSSEALQERLGLLKQEALELRSVLEKEARTTKLKADGGLRDLAEIREPEIRQENVNRASAGALATNLGTTQVHDRLFYTGAAQQARLNQLREKLELKGSTDHMPKINDTSRKMVETSRKKNSVVTEENGIQKENSSDIWREYATADGYLYYFNDATKETRWERPTKGQVVPFVAVKNVRRYSVDQAKANLGKT